MEFLSNFARSIYITKKGVTIHDLADLIIDKNPEKVPLGWNELLDALECPSEERQKLERSIKEKNNIYRNALIRMLKNWALRNHEKTVDDLYKILISKKIQTVQLAGMESNGSLKNEDLNLESVDGVIPPKHTNLPNIVQILIEDQPLLNNWSQFSDFMECPPVLKIELKFGFNNQNLKMYDIFSRILENWTERNPNKTIAELSKVLKKMNCVAVAEKLEKNFGKDNMIQIQSDLMDNRPMQKKMQTILPAIHAVVLNAALIGGFWIVKQPEEGLRVEFTKTISNEFVRSNNEIKWPLIHGFLLPTSNFGGREKQLEQLNLYINSNDTNLILICGFGGVGKTELCRKFANEISSFNESKISRLWLRGETFETLRDSVLGIAKELGVKNRANPPPSEYFAYLAQFILENCDKLLVVIDNVDDIYDEVVNIIRIIHMAKNENRVFVIVTSRHKNVLDNAGITIPLDIPEKEHVRKMLQKSMTNLTDSDADQLGELLQYFPLALQQAVAYIKQQRKNFRTQNYSVSDYIEEFGQKKSEMLSHKLNTFEHEYSMTTLVTWDIIIDKMNKSAVDILKIVAFLNADGIELDFLEEISKQRELSDFDNNINILDNYSLVKIDGKVISIHRLVQEVVRLKVENNEQYVKSLFDSVFLASQKYKVVKASELEKIHLQSVYKFAWQKKWEQINNFQDGLFFLLKHDRLDCAIKYTKLHFPHIQFSSWFKREFLEKVLLWSFFNYDDLPTREAIEKGSYSVENGVVGYVTVKALTTVSKISQKYFGQSSGITFAVKNQLITELCSSYEMEKAIEICEEFVSFPFDEKESKIFFETIDCILPYANSSQLLRVEKILRNFREVDTLIEWLELQAKILYFKGEYKKSLELYEKMIIRLQGNNLKINFYESKVTELKMKIRLDLEKTERILTIYEEMFGQNHLLTVRVKNMMAEELRFYDIDRCVKLCEEVLHSSVEGEYKKAFGNLILAKNMGYDEQRKILETVLKNKQMKFGNSHNNTLRLMAILAEKAKESGDSKFASEIFEKMRKFSNAPNNVINSEEFLGVYWIFSLQGLNMLWSQFYWMVFLFLIAISAVICFKTFKFVINYFYIRPKRLRYKLAQMRPNPCDN